MVAIGTAVDSKPATTKTKTFYYNVNLTWKNSPKKPLQMAEATVNDLQPTFDRVDYIERREARHEHYASEATLNALSGTGKSAEDIAIGNEESERVREFKIKIRSQLPPKPEYAEIYDHLREYELSIPSIIQNVSLNANQVYYRLRIINEIEKKLAVDFFSEATFYLD